MAINVLYKYLLCSGTLGGIYSEIFLKVDGVGIIRNLQSYLETIKDRFSVTSWEEQSYLVSLIIIHLYREIKVDKNIMDRRKENYANTIETQYFEDFKDLSLNMQKDLTEMENNPYDGLEELLPSQIIHNPIVTKIFSRLEALLKKEMNAEPDKKPVFARKFMDLLLICFDKKINRRRYMNEDTESFRIQRKTLLDRLLIDFINSESR